MSTKPKSKTRPKPIFATDRRIRLGIWGLGRGMSFYRTCSALNFDVVAGCDYNEHMRARFLRDNPGAFVTADAEEFLAQEIDAVLLATFCVAHAPDAIRCLEAGKHVLSEVTSFFTMAEGVRLVEAVERSGLVYNLAENYPFTPPNMYLARKWKEGLFGDLMYAEYEYVHECRSLCYTYIDGKPVQPGHTVHNWRSWLNFHYYCTHSLGPVMVITGTRPTRVVALPGRQRLAGYLVDLPAGMGGIAPSLITMDNGGVVRNLMGSTTNDTHLQRIWGTLGAAELNAAKPMSLRLGGSGHSPKLEVVPTLDALQLRAAETGHGGGDFWVLYHFANQILFGTPAPFDIYAAADVTIPGILAYRSSLEDGRPYDVPDFRKQEQRDLWRNDHGAQPRYDVIHGPFPDAPAKERGARFSTLMAELIGQSLACRAYLDWRKVAGETPEVSKIIELGENLALNLPRLRQIYREARELAQACPGTDGARVLLEMLQLGHEEQVLAPGFLRELKRQLATLRRKHPAAAVRWTEASASPLLSPVADIAKPKAPDKGLKPTPLPFDPKANRLDFAPLHKGDRDGALWLQGKMELLQGGKGRLFLECPAPIALWLNGRRVACVREAQGVPRARKFSVPVTWKKGRNDLRAAVALNCGKNPGLLASSQLDP